ncbi:protein kinase [Acaryochloris sp. IP29b_bin.137]|uniref:serine/threonine protein kinase n=1 Tax=Acaryochloris sp. IP29b_bin.137 TaxID=2969217 RepID=UPI00262435C9|nr:protein kinase [Acaryochloris sp. IP29b_bin.137]
MKPLLPTMVLLPLGTLLQKGTYRLDQLTGHRGWQLTYEGTHLPSQQPVLIETLNPSRQQPKTIAQQRNTFLQQAQAWQQLNHPSLEPVRDVFVESVLPFLVKDKLSGQTWDMQVEHQPMPEADAIAQITQIADGLHRAHQQHLWHGDIQPKNVVVHPQDHRPILVNWVWRPNTPGLLPPNSHAYAAPEAAQGQQTVATDIYGLAATLYTLVTGQAPVTASQRQHIRLEFHPPSLSQATVVAILRGMAIQPQHRPPSLPEWLELFPTPSPPPVSFSTESGNIGPDSPAPILSGPLSPAHSSTLEASAASASDPTFPAPEVSSPSSFVSKSENHSTATTSKSTVPLQEPNPTVSPTRLQSYSAPPRFPFRALILCSVLSGVVGIAFGLLLRFHYQNQFTNPQVPAKAPPVQVQNEDFLPKPGSTRRPIEELPTPTETPLESPTPPTLEEPDLNPQFDPEGESDPTLQEPVPLSPDPLATDAPHSDLQTPIEPYPDPSAPDVGPSPFDPFSTPDFSTPPPSDTSTDFQ